VIKYIKEIRTSGSMSILIKSEKLEYGAYVIFVVNSRFVNKETEKSRVKKLNIRKAMTFSFIEDFSIKK